MTDRARDLFDQACAYDRAGREEEAIPCYREALEAGLPDALRPQALLGLGSSLRNVRRHGEAVAVLEEAVVEHPSHAALRVFLALALRSAGREREAFQALGALVLDEVDLRGYDRTTAFYLEHLD